MDRISINGDYSGRPAGKVVSTDTRQNSRRSPSRFFLHRFKSGIAQPGRSSRQPKSLEMLKIVPQVLSPSPEQGDPTNQDQVDELPKTGSLSSAPTLEVTTSLDDTTNHIGKLPPKLMAEVARSMTSGEVSRMSRTNKQCQEGFGATLKKAPEGGHVRRVTSPVSKVVTSSRTTISPEAQKQVVLIEWLCLKLKQTSVGEAGLSGRYNRAVNRLLYNLFFVGRPDGVDRELQEIGQELSQFVRKNPECSLPILDYLADHESIQSDFFPSLEKITGDWRDERVRQIELSLSVSKLEDVINDIKETSLQIYYLDRYVTEHDWSDDGLGIGVLLDDVFRYNKFKCSDEQLKVLRRELIAFAREYPGIPTQIVDFFQVSAQAPSTVFGRYRENRWSPSDLRRGRNR